MPAHTPSSVAGEEPTFTRSVFEAILAGMGRGDPFEAEYVCSDDGARVKHVEEAGLLAWHPWSEVTTPGSPDPLDEPWLRFPFTARQLAALMTDGWGNLIQEKYGDWDDGPDEDELRSIGSLGGKAKEALRFAYAAYRQAVEMAPRLDRALEDSAREITRQFRAAREAAKAREQLREHRGSDAEYTARLARVNETVADLRRAKDDARQVADTAHARWRRAVVEHLLLPIEDVSADSFACSMLRALPPERRAAARHQMQAQQEFQDSAEGEAHWELVSEKTDLEKELRRWQLMTPLTVTEAVHHEVKLKELEGRLSAVKHRLDNWTWVPGNASGTVLVMTDPPSSSTVLLPETPGDRQRRRLRDLRERFGGDMVFRSGTWGARDRQSGAFKNLVSQEAGNGSTNCSAKSVRADLVEAAQAEAADKRAGKWAERLA